MFRNSFSIILRSRLKLSLTSAKKTIYIRILYIDFIIIDIAKSLHLCIFLNLFKTFILSLFILVQYFSDISIVQSMKNNCVNFLNIWFRNRFAFLRRNVKSCTAKLISLTILFISSFSSSSFFLKKIIFLKISYMLSCWFAQLRLIEF